MHLLIGLRPHDTGASHNCGLGVTFCYYKEKVCYYKEKYVENYILATHSPEDSTM